MYASWKVCLRRWSCIYFNGLEDKVHLPKVATITFGADSVFCKYLEANIMLTKILQNDIIVKQNVLCLLRFITN